MTIGVYCIENEVDGKKYIGKSINVEARIKSHKYCLKKESHHNAHLQNAVLKYGIKNFKFYLLETLEELDHIALAFREMYWIDFFGTLDRDNGYNLLYDSPNGTQFHPETRKKYSEGRIGELNANFGNQWSSEQKQRMSKIAIDRHAKGVYYGQSWREKIGKASTEMWRDEEKKSKMAKAVSEAKSMHSFYQYEKPCKKFIKVWASINDILEANPDWKRQNIYAACNGHKKSYQGFLWEMKPKKWAFLTPDDIEENFWDSEESVALPWET